MVIETNRLINTYDSGFEAAIAADSNFMRFRSLPITSHLTYKQAMLMFNCLNERRFSAGQTIYEAGTPSNNTMYLILSGSIAANNGNGHRFNALKVGDVFGLFSFLDEDRSHSATLVSEEDSVALCIDRPYFDVITLEDPALGTQLLRFMFHLLSRMALKQEVEYANIHDFALGIRH